MVEPRTDDSVNGNICGAKTGKIEAIDDPSRLKEQEIDILILVLSGMADQLNSFESEEALEAYLLKEVAKSREELSTEMQARVKTAVLMLSLPN